jgi:hypothetical protein
MVYEMYNKKEMNFAGVFAYNVDLYMGLLVMVVAYCNAIMK